MDSAGSAEKLDYAPCSYGTSRLLFRGPEASLDGYGLAVVPCEPIVSDGFVALAQTNEVGAVDY